jgi:hypothetical protein
MLKRLLNISQWIILMLESLITFNKIPYSTKFIFNIPNNLKYKERIYISEKITNIGISSIIACFAFGFGVFGKYSPKDIFQDIVFEETLKNINNKCCICLNNFDINIENKLSECNHLFHKDCIDKWFHNNKRCPLCNYSSSS